MTAWNESDHPRIPAGSSKGGWFTFKESLAESSARVAAGLDPLVVGISYAKKIPRSKRNRYGGPQLEVYGLGTDPEVMGSQTEAFEYFEKKEKAQEAKVHLLEDRNYFDQSISHSIEPDAGFPKDHPFADPVLRNDWVHYAAGELSYSNMVGLGGALKAASQGRKTDELYTYFSRKLPKGVTLEDVLTAMQKETEGMLKKLKVENLVLWHGTTSEFGKSIPSKGSQTFNLANFYQGISSWSSSKYIASQFGNYLVKAIVPAKYLISIPVLMPSTIYGEGAQAQTIASLFGGTRSEAEYIVWIR